MTGVSETILVDRDFSSHFVKVREQVNFIKSTEDYEGWKQQTKDIYYHKFPNNKANVDKFIEYISLILDKHQRAYLPRKVMWYLWGKRNWVIKNNQHFWVAFIGKKGGEGKSTLSDYFSMVLDPTYIKKNRSEQDYDKWLDIIPKAVKEIKYPAIVLDEPDNKTHDLSKKGRERKDILERIRILNMFVGVCANSLTSVPQMIYERLSAVVFINNEHRFWIWDSTKDKPKETVVEDIKGKDGWGRHRHALFRKQEFVKRACFKHLTFTHPKFSPFETKIYDNKKREDIIGRIQNYNSKVKDKGRLEGQGNRILQEILKLKKLYPKLTDGQIGLRLGLRRETINRYRNAVVSGDTGQL